MTGRHALRNRLILGGFVFCMIPLLLDDAGVLPWNPVVLLLVSLALYGALALAAVTVRFLVTGKNVRQP